MLNYFVEPMSEVLFRRLPVALVDTFLFCSSAIVSLI